MKLTGYIAKIVMIIIAVVSVILVGLCYWQEAFEANKPAAMAEGSWTGTTIWWAIAVLLIGLASVVVAWIADIVTDLSKLIKSVIFVILALGLVFVCYSLSDGTPLDMPGYEGDENVEKWLRIADTGLFIAYFTIGAAVVSIVSSFVAKWTR